MEKALTTKTPNKESSSSKASTQKQADGNGSVAEPKPRRGRNVEAVVLKTASGRIGNPNFSPRAQKDYDLVCLAVAGDESAFTKLMDNHKEAITYMMLRLVHNRDDAEDLTIEAFGKAFNSIHNYTPDYAFSTWLYTIARNNAIDFKRKKRLETLSIDEEPHEDSSNSYAESIKSHGLDPEEAYMKAQRAELMREVTQRISPKYRRLIELRFFKEYSYDEIATELELPLGTVKAQLFRAKELMQNILRSSRDKI